MSMGSSKSSVLSTDTASSVSQPSEDKGGEPADLKIPAAAACVSVGELSVAEGPLRPLELRAMRMCEGLVDMVVARGAQARAGPSPRELSSH